ncbi:hypothetical protein BEL01nite_76350 [Bradyrhizobium elkanii]|nr:hypothetical protein BEL01nite_76350 [Bradyrhizobium elkanii]
MGATSMKERRDGSLGWGMVVPMCNLVQQLIFFTLPWRGRVDANEMSGGVG